MFKAIIRVLVATSILVVLPASLMGETQGDVLEGKKLYKEQCVLCHGKAGEGWDWDGKVAKPPVTVPNLPKVLPERSDE